MTAIATYSEQSNKVHGISFTPPDLSSGISKSYRITMEEDEDGRVVVRCPDLQGVVTDGADEKEAIQNAFEAMNAILETRGLPKEYNLTIIHKLSA
jgi:predicted RNase H-like HicB family nuclease